MQLDTLQLPASQAETAERFEASVPGWWETTAAEDIKQLTRVCSGGQAPVVVVSGDSFMLPATWAEDGQGGQSGEDAERSSTKR